MFEVPVLFELHHLVADRRRTDGDAGRPWRPDPSRPVRRSRCSSSPPRARIDAFRSPSATSSVSVSSATWQSRIPSANGPGNPPPPPDRAGRRDFVSAVALRYRSADEGRRHGRSRVHRCQSLPDPRRPSRDRPRWSRSTTSPAATRRNLDRLRVDLVTADIGDPDALVGCVRRCRAVVHLAARPSVPKSVDDPVASHVANTTGTLNVLEAVRATGGPHLVVASSSSVYGANPTLPKSEDLVTAPLSPYAAQKLATEQYSLAHAHSYDLDVLAFRFFNVFGPLQPAGHAYARGDPGVRVGGPRRPSRSRCTATVSSPRLHLRRLGRRGHRRCHRAPHLEREPGQPRLRRAGESARGHRRDRGDPRGHARRSHEPPRVGDVRHSQADQTRLRSLFPDLESRSTSPRGLRTTIDWWRSQL